MKIKLVIELDERMRLAIAHHFGQGHPPANYEECKRHLNAAITGDLQNIAAEYDKFHEELETSDVLPGTGMARGTGSHDYPGCREGFDFTSDCANGCGCWMGGSRSGGPEGVDPFGTCPKAPTNTA